MGSHVSTDAVPFTLEDIAFTQQELSRQMPRHAHLLSPRSGSTGATPSSGDGHSALALPSEVVDHFDGIDHNVKAFRLFFRPSGGGLQSPRSGSANPPSPANGGNSYNDPSQLAASPSAAMNNRRSAGERRGSTTLRGALAPAVAGGGIDPIVSSHVRVEPVSLSAAHVKVRASDVYLVIHVQRLPTAGHTAAASPRSGGPSAHPSPVSPMDEMTPRLAQTIGGRQLAEDAETYGADRTPSWAAQVADIVTPRGLAVAFASDVGRPTVAAFAASQPTSAAAAGANGVGSAAPARSSPPAAAPSSDKPTECQFSIHLLTGKRAHALTAAVAVLHALQLERRFAESPELARRLFFNCNLARVHTGGNPTSAVAGIERGRVGSLLVVTRPVSVGQLSLDGSESGGNSARSQSGQPGIFSFAGPALSESYGKNALLRLLHSARLPLSAPTPRLSLAAASTSTSAQYSYSSTPRGGPGGSFSAVNTATGGTFTQKTSTGMVTMQGPPTLEIPKLHTSAGALPHRAHPSLRSGATPRAQATLLRLAPTSPHHATSAAAAKDVASSTPSSATSTSHATTPAATDAADRGAKGRAPQTRSPKTTAATSSRTTSRQGNSGDAKPHRSSDTTAAAAAAAVRTPSTSSVSTSSTTTAAPEATGLPVMADLNLSEVLGRACAGRRGPTAHTARRPSTLPSSSTTAAAAAGAAQSRHGVGRHRNEALSTDGAAEGAARVTSLALTNLPKSGGFADSALADDGRSGEDAQPPPHHSRHQRGTHLGEDGDAGGSHDVRGDDEANEKFMSEDRVLRLRQAAPEATEVLPWLFVGGEEAARDRRQLLEKGITAVVNTVAFDLPNFHEDVLRYLPLNVCDAPDEPIFSLFPIVNRFVDVEKEVHDGKVFIHCHQGVSRSCSFVIAYVMWKQGMCYDRAFELVRRARKVCSPNTGFYVNLRLWEDQLVKPVFNKAFAFVPYTSSYAFPFCFRLALTFRKSASAKHDDDDASIINPYTQVVEEGGTCVLDARVCYGFLLGERPTSAAVKAAPLSSFSYTGRRCDPVVSQRAQQEWLSFVNYSFYQGPKRTSVNDKMQTLSFLPLAALDTHSFLGAPVTSSSASPSNRGGSAAMVTSALDTADVVRRVSKHMFPFSTRPTAFMVKEERFEKFEPLFQHEKLIFSFAMRLEGERKARKEDETRKRAREDEVRRGASTSRSPSRGARHGQASDSGHTAKSMGSLSGHSHSHSSGAGTARQQPSQPPSAAVTNSSANPPTAAAAPPGLRVAAPPAVPHTGAPSPCSQIVLGGDPRHTNGAAPPSQGDDKHSNGSKGQSTSLTAAALPFLNLRLPGGLRGAPPDAEESLPPLTDVVVLRFPFDEGVMQAADAVPGDDVHAAAILLEDLDPAECYAVVVPDTGTGTMGNRVFLWIGAESHATEDDVWQAFYSHVAVPQPQPQHQAGAGGGEEKANAATASRESGSGRRGAEGPSSYVMVHVPGRQSLHDVLPEVVVGGEEPDELLLVM